MELKVGQHYKRVLVGYEDKLYTLRNVLVFDALSAELGAEPRYIIGIPATAVPASAILEAEEDDE